jgi:peptidoglycan/LPS O-acetylase OafA/YrhL
MNTAMKPNTNSPASETPGLALPLGQSLYLDLVRFLMALEVMIGHATFHGYTGRGFLWQLDPFRHLQTAVVGFFVLSGFVIAFAVKTRETGPRSYTVARVSRMHSVIVPALLLTWAADTLGQAINPGFYKTWDFPTPIPDGQVLRYLLSFFYVNNTGWLPGMNPGSNGPFWTMTYEVFYYAMFGVAVFARGVARIAGLALLCVAGGLSILLYLPIWLLGAAAYHLQCGRRLPLRTAAATFLLSLLGTGTLSTLGPTIKPLFPGAAMLLYYAMGVLVALNLWSAATVAPSLARALQPAQGLIRWLGMLTFALYLGHRPLLNLFAVVPVAAPGAWLQTLWVLGGTFVVCIGLAHAGESFRPVIKRGLISCFAIFGRQISPKERR